MARTPPWCRFGGTNPTLPHLDFGGSDRKGGPTVWTGGTEISPTVCQAQAKHRGPIGIHQKVSRQLFLLIFLHQFFCQDLKMISMDLINKYTQSYSAFLRLVSVL